MVGTHLGKGRIVALVSNETIEMWNEITESDKQASDERYYPSHTLERLIQSEYKIMKAFGTNKRTKKSN